MELLCSLVGRADSQAAVVGSQAAAVDIQAAVVGCQSFRDRPAVGVAVGGIGLQGGQEAVVLVVWLNAPAHACLKLMHESS